MRAIALICVGLLAYLILLESDHRAALQHAQATHQERTAQREAGCVSITNQPTAGVRER